MQKSKRGISPVIATVLLISLVVVLAAIIFMWMKSFVGEQIQKNGLSADQACEELSYEANYEVKGAILELQIVNRGSIPIGDFDIKFTKGGDSSVSHFGLFEIDVGMTSERKEIPTQGASTITIYPMLNGQIVGKGTAKTITCLKKETVINL